MLNVNILVEGALTIMYYPERGISVSDASVHLVQLSQITIGLFEGMFRLIYMLPGIILNQFGFNFSLLRTALLNH